MKASIECRKCGADIPIDNAKPGEQVTCEKCETANLIPLPAPQTSTIKVMGKVIDWLWYAALVLFVVSVLTVVMCIPTMGDIELFSWEKLPVPIRVIFDEPLRVEHDEAIPDPEALHARGFEALLVDRWLGALGFFWATALLSLGLLLWVIYQVRAFFNNVRSGRPFSRDNPKRIRYMAYSIFAYVAIDIAGLIMLGHAYIRHIDIPGARVEIAITWMDRAYVELVTLGVLLFVIAQIFDWGCRLQQEHDLTV